MPTRKGVAVTTRIADSIARLGTESAFEVLARAKALEAQGRRVIHLEIGEPDFATPPHIVEAAIAALRDGHTHYCPAAGLPSLRSAAAAYLSGTRAVSVDPERVVVAPGAKPFLFFGVLATCGRGDEVVYPDPGFPIYRSVVDWVGATPVPLPLTQERGFAPDPDQLRALLTDRTRLVILNFPGNPTGGVLTGERARDIAAVLADHDCWVLSDEVYSELCYDAAHTSVASSHDLLERTILLDSCSKTFAMTGWRVGYAALPAALVEPVTRLIINSVSCTPPASQLAAVAALEGSWEPVESMRAEFRRRRDTVVGGLDALPGVRCAEPRGAFYAFPDVAGTGSDPRELADRLLAEAGVAVLPGSGFGDQGATHLRISYAASVDDLRDAIAALGTLLDEHG